MQYVSVHGPVSFRRHTPMAGNALLIADFSNLHISSSTSAAGAVSQLTVRFSTRAPLGNNTVIEVRGLGGYCTIAPQVTLTADGPFQSTANFSYTAGALRLRVAQTTIADSTYTAAFALRNCEEPRAVANQGSLAASPLILFTSTAGMKMEDPAAVVAGVYIVPTPFPASNLGVVLGILSAEMRQATPSTGASNLLTISRFQVNINVSAPHVWPKLDLFNIVADALPLPSCSLERAGVIMLVAPCSLLEHANFRGLMPV